MHAFLLGLSLALAASAPDAKPAPPNILFLVVDDVNDWVGPLGGHPQARTPNMDRLAARGITFTNAHCASPICIPSRTAALTGILPHVSGITTNGGDFRDEHPDTVTLPQLLRTKGYTAWGFGKVFHESDSLSFDRDRPARGNHRDREPQPAITETLGQGIEWGAIDGDGSKLSDFRTADLVIAELGREHKKPFFLAAGTVLAHVPWNLPQANLDLFPLDEIQLPEVRADDADDLPPIGRAFANSAFHGTVVERGQWEAAVRAYLAAIAFADAQIGRMLDALEAGPNAANTIVVLWSDHGFHLGEKNRWQKSSLWREATRVPLIFAGPGIPRGETRDGAVGLVDLYPTIAELCGVEAPEFVDGHSIVPMLSDASARRPAPVLTVMGFEHSVHSDRWHYIRYHDGGEELYDVVADPNEWTNLADDPAFADVKNEWAEWVPERPDAPRSFGRPVDKKKKRRTPFR